MKISHILPSFFSFFSHLLCNNTNVVSVNTSANAFSNNCMSGAQITGLIEALITFRVGVLKAYDNEY